MCLRKSCLLLSPFPLANDCLSINASLIETNIAIIVGCVPAFAHFAGKAIWGSTFFKSLRSRFLGSRGQSGKSMSGVSSKHKPKTPELVTFGNLQGPKRKNYTELSDTALLNTEGNTIPGDHAEEHEMRSMPYNSYNERYQGV